MDKIKALKDKAIEAVKGAPGLGALKIVENRFLGRDGELTGLLRSLKNLPEKERKERGELANKIKAEIIDLIKIRKNELEKIKLEKDLKAERVDVSHPGKKPAQGHIHPLSLIIKEAGEIFNKMGFTVVEGPEIETEWYNFDALNIPEDHPAREMWDTFWLRQKKQEIRNKKQTEKLLLRTHTSPMQIRYLETHNPPLRIVVPGRCFRFEATDASHDTHFYQLEGLMVDKNASAANFKSVIQTFLSNILRRKVEVRLRPSFFPFTEPSFEVDVTCAQCSGKGGKCSVCSGSGWLEMMGAGMVHPGVFKNAGLNPKEWQGFAFGMGLDRIAMIRYKIPDIRLFYSSDLRFLNQF